ncbi:MAG TPA: hypothetical protein VK525_03295 [Candidatus Saccharimonadales bacterium]|nr:hypothetical protein [Candidatus Saccharimonadales bacterium]
MNLQFWKKSSTGPDAAASLAGLVLAHAAWSVSDLPEGELLVPLAMIEKAGQRELHRFEAETQEQAIAEGKAAMGQLSGSVDAWAFAREGQFNEGSGYVDVLSIDAWAKGMTASISFVQKFRPFASGKFELLGEPLVVIAGESQNPSASSDLLTKLARAIQSHPKAAEHWSEWFVKTN